LGCLYYRGYDVTQRDPTHPLHKIYLRECLEAYFKGKKIRPEYLIVENGEIVSPSYAAAFA
jgi:hypothetical protein